jgi:hypothetical protein
MDLFVCLFFFYFSDKDSKSVDKTRSAFWRVVCWHQEKVAEFSHVRKGQKNAVERVVELKQSNNEKKKKTKRKNHFDIIQPDNAWNEVCSVQSK